MTLSVFSNGVEYSLDDGTYCYWLDHDGFGMLPLHRLSLRGGQQDGDFDVGFRADPRFIRLFLLFEDMGINGWLEKRQALLNIFSPQRILQLRLTVDSTLRQIDCKYSSDLSMPSAEAFGSYGQRLVVTLKASTPTWYDPTIHELTFQLGGGSDVFTVPTVIPTGIGTSTIFQTQQVIYGGSWSASPEIKIYGPATNLVISNLTTGDKLDFTGQTIAGGSWWLATTEFGQQSLVDQAGVSQVSKLTSDSDLATFHFASSSETPDGNNSISISASSITSATRIEIKYVERFLGV